jgi:hypothetical protein
MLLSAAANSRVRFTDGSVGRPPAECHTDSMFGVQYRALERLLSGGGTSLPRNTTMRTNTFNS